MNQWISSVNSYYAAPGFINSCAMRVFVSRNSASPPTKTVVADRPCHMSGRSP